MSDVTRKRSNRSSSKRSTQNRSSSSGTRYSSARRISSNRFSLPPPEMDPDEFMDLIYQVAGHRTRLGFKREGWTGREGCKVIRSFFRRLPILYNTELWKNPAFQKDLEPQRYIFARCKLWWGREEGDWFTKFQAFIDKWYSEMEKHISKQLILTL